MMKHGHTAGRVRSPTWVSWKAMHRRCRPDHLQRSNYYDRGVRVCERWRVFENFVADMGLRPPGTTLDRIDNDKGYDAGNCCWSTWVEQQNNRSNNVRYDYQGKRLTLRQCIDCAPARISYSAAARRLTLGWSIDRAVGTPVRRQVNNAKET